VSTAKPLPSPAPGVKAPQTKRQAPKRAAVADAAAEIPINSGAYLLPPRPDVCQACAVKHSPEQPHNQQSLYWQYWFHGKHQRWPTWADAMAHCEPDIRQFWVSELGKHGVNVDLPPPIVQRDRGAETW
jgi:hypothetical protein